MRRKPIIGLIYDFDGTLSPGNMQEFGFIQAIGQTPEEFWAKSDGIAIGQDASNILAYMKLMHDEAKKNHIRLTRSGFHRFGADIKLYDGVREWFNNVNEYGKQHGVIIEHYINSSGLTEIIEGSPIAKYFKHIFAGSYIYDEKGEAEWPGIAVDYTAKTQYLFKIQKGIFSSRDAQHVNESMADDAKRLPSRPAKKATAQKLLRQGRVNFITPASYTKDSRTFRLVCAIIDKIKADSELRQFSRYK